MRAHEWTVVAEFDAGYVIGRCQVCSQQDLLDVGALLPVPRPAAVAADALPADELPADALPADAAAAGR